MSDQIKIRRLDDIREVRVKVEIGTVWPSMEPGKYLEVTHRTFLIRVEKLTHESNHKFPKWKLVGYKVPPKPVWLP